MKKFLLFCIIMIACILFAGCGTEVDMSCGIDEDFTAYIDLHVKVDAMDVGETNRQYIISALDKLASKCSLHGYVTEKDYFISDTDTACLDMRISEVGYSYDDAFDNLRQMLTDEDLTPFTNLTIETSEALYNKAFRFTGSIDAHRVIPYEYLSTLPQTVSEYYTNGIENSRFTLTLSLPTYEITEYSGELVQTGRIHSSINYISFEESTEVTLCGKTLILFGSVSVCDTPAQQLLIYIAICLAAVLIFVLSFISFKKKRGKPKVSVQENTQL